jgi:hypothetical protein
MRVRQAGWGWWMLGAMSVGGCAAGAGSTVTSQSASGPAPSATPFARTAPSVRAIAPVASATAVPAPSAGALPRRRLPDDDFDNRQPAEAVKRELEQFKKSYAPLEPVRSLPDFLSVDAVVALMPDENSRDTVREGLHRELAGESENLVLGGYLDEEQQLFALFLNSGVLTDVLVVFDHGRLASKIVTSRAQPVLGDVLPERDGTRREILLERITSPSLCCLPISLEVYRVSKRGALTLVLDHPRGHVDVGPGDRWSFLNHFEFSDKGVKVSRAFPEGGPSYEYAFDAASGHYRPTPATLKQLAEEQQRRTNARKSGSKVEPDVLNEPGEFY